MGFGPRECENKISRETIPPGEVSNLNLDGIMIFVWLVGGGGTPPPIHTMLRELCGWQGGGGGPSEPLDLL